MFLLELLTQYLDKTRPVAALLTMPLIFVQMAGGLLPLASLYRSVRRDSVTERVLLCTTPAIFIVTFAFVEPLFFGSFLGEGFPWVEALRRFLYQPAFFAEAAALAGAFWVLLLAGELLRGRRGRFSTLGFFLSAGAELPVSLALLALSGDYFWRQGDLFLSLGDAALKWLVYGVYLVLYKDGVLGLCLLWQLLFSERARRGGALPDCDRWLRRYLSRTYRVYGWSILMFSALWAFAVVGGLYREGSEYLWALAVNALLLAIALGCLAGVFWRPNYRRILTWGLSERTLPQLYHEIVELPPLVKTDIGFLTEHYFVKTLPKGIYCRALLEPDDVEIKPMGVCLLHFQDGSTCRLNGAYASLLGPLLGGRYPGRAPTGRWRE